MMRKTREDILLDTLNTVILLCVIVLTLYPFLYVLIISLNEGVDASRGGIYLWPRRFSLESYSELLSNNKWLQGILISVLRTVGGTVMGVFFTAMVAFGLSYRKLRYARGYYIFMIVAMYFHGGLIPYYVVLRSLGLLNTFWVYVIPGLISIFYVLVMVSFFREIPTELEEAAAIDGANDLYTFVRIILPVSKPVLATVALFMAVGHWNSWIDSAYFVQKTQLRTLAYLMMEVINQSLIQVMRSGAGGMAMSYQESSAQNTTNFTTESLQMAAIIIAVTPVLAVYPFLQKYFVKGVLLGSVKG